MKKGLRLNFSIPSISFPFHFQIRKLRPDEKGITTMIDFKLLGNSLQVRKLRPDEKGITTIISWVRLDGSKLFMIRKLRPDEKGITTTWYLNAM